MLFIEFTNIKAFTCKLCGFFYHDQAGLYIDDFSHYIEICLECGPDSCSFNKDVYTDVDESDQPDNCIGGLDAEL